MVDAPMGLIAGQGKLPILEARGLRAAGRAVACVGLAGQFDPLLEQECDIVRPAGVIQIGKWIRILHRFGAQEAIMVGAVSKARIYEPLKIFRQLPDLRAAKLWYRVLKEDRRDQTLLTAVANELSKNGIELVDNTRYIPDHIATKGVMTRRKPDKNQQGDIDFAASLLSGLNELDIGQALAVKDGDVIAVEAIEGTQAMIRRAGELCRSGGWTLCKGAHEKKDMRFDVPTIGIETIEQLKAAGGKCLALVARRTIMADKPKVLEAADKAKIVVVGI